MFWTGGNLDKTNTNQNFIYAFSPSSVSGGATGDLAQHVAVGTFQLDMTAAIGAGGVPTVVSPVTSWGWSTTVLAHAVMMGLVWVGALPAGAVIIRFLDTKFKNPAFVHQYLQLSSFGIVFIAFFIGVGTHPLPVVSCIDVRRLQGTTFQIRSSMDRINTLSRLNDPRRSWLVPP